MHGMVLTDPEGRNDECTGTDWSGLGRIVPFAVCCALDGDAVACFLRPIRHARARNTKLFLHPVYGNGPTSR
jgi:hypothetical protein